MRAADTRPVMEIAVEPKSAADREKLDSALAAMAAEDASFNVHVDHESGQIILGGHSELHLESKLSILAEVDGIGINVGAPQVAYRETITRAADITHTYSKHLGPMWPFASVKIRFEPGEPGSGLVFEITATESAVPNEFIRGVRQGIERASGDGLRAGFPVIDFKATLYDGAFSEIESSIMAFERASRGAFRELCEKGEPVLLEPIMKVEVVTPDEYMGDVIGDLNSRRGQILGSETQSDSQVVTALVPLSNMFGYINTLRSFSQGRASYEMAFDHYAPLPVVPDDDPAFRPAMGMRA